MICEAYADEQKTVSGTYQAVKGVFVMEKTRTPGVNTKTLLLLMTLFMICFMIMGCEQYQRALITRPAKAIDQSGAYTVIRVGGSHSEDYSAFALLIPETGKFRFDVYKPDFEYRTAKGLTAKQALDMAETFVAAQPYFNYSQTSEIMGPEGNVIGYEVRPLYREIMFGQSDILLIAYLLRANNTVEVRVDIHEAVTNRQRS